MVFLMGLLLVAVGYTGGWVTKKWVTDEATIGKNAITGFIASTKSIEDNVKAKLMAEAQKL